MFRIDDTFLLLGVHSSIAAARQKCREGQSVGYDHIKESLDLGCMPVSDSGTMAAKKGT